MSDSDDDYSDVEEAFSPQPTKCYGQETADKGKMFHQKLLRANRKRKELKEERRKDAEKMRRLEVEATTAKRDAREKETELLNLNRSMAARLVELDEAEAKT